MYLILCSAHETVQFAAEELKEYLSKAGLFDVCILPEAAADPQTPSLYLGTAKDLPSGSLSEDPLDDAFHIQIDAGAGYICGSNPRSVLLGVYALLRKLGFDWPSPQTEVYLPDAPLTFDTFHCRLQETAAVRHRGIVLEGANSLDNVLDIIAWMPKLYYNSYFIQFKLPYYFFANWYRHVENPYLPAEKFTENDALRIKKTIESALKKRDLLYHAVGHAWTSESIGIKGLGWDPESVPLTDWQKDRIALVNGKRQLFDEITLNTNLCYSDSASLQAITDDVLSYIKDNPQTDYLHIWLADGYNNFCECPECLHKLPSDQYIDLLNHIDAVLTEQDISVKLVFLVYYDLLWAPQSKQFVNPDRFVLMFAPISRTYESSYADVHATPVTAEYQKNKIQVPHSVEENLAYLADWQTQFHGDSFVFDYPLGRAHYGDPGYMKIAQTIYRDIHSLSKLNLNGYLSCQEQRCFFPHALPNYLMGLSLWNLDLSFEEICHRFFKNSYGQDGLSLLPLLQKISFAFNTDYWNHVIPHYQPWYKSQLKDVADYADQLEKLIADHSNRQKSRPVSDTSLSAQIFHWQILSYLPEYLRLTADCLSAKADGNGEEAAIAFRRFQDYVCRQELNLQPMLDVFRLLNLARNYVDLDNPEKDQ